MQLRGSGFRVLGVWWLVAAVVAVGVLVIGDGHLRLGGQIMAAGVARGGICAPARSHPREREAQRRGLGLRGDGAGGELHGIV